MQMVLTWMDFIATLYLFYIYLKCSELQSVTARVEKKVCYVVQMTASAGCLKQRHLVWLNQSMAKGNFSQQIY